MISSLLIVSGRILGMEATHVLSRSNLGFLSPLYGAEEGERGEGMTNSGTEEEDECTKLKEDSWQ